MKGFLETYGVAIFTLVLVAILIAFAGPLGIKIKNATTDKVSQTEQIGKDEIQNSVNSKEEEKCEAFAVYSADDNSISFYKRETLPNIGEQFEGKTVTKIYTGIETTQYKDTNLPEWNSDLTALCSYYIVDKIKPISTVSFFYGAKEIYNIQNLNTSNVTDMTAMFRETVLTNLDLSSFDTSQVTSMINMFYECNSLTNLDVNNWNTSQVTDMRGMFGECNSLTTLNLSSFDTKQVTSMLNMFYECNSLTNLDLSSFDTSQVVSMYCLFYNCSSLSTLYFSNWNTSQVKSMGSMFSGCTSLTSLNLDELDFSNVNYTGYMFRECSSLLTKSIKVSQATYDKLITDEYLGISADKFNIVK